MAAWPASQAVAAVHPTAVAAAQAQRKPMAARAELAALDPAAARITASKVAMER